MPVGYCGVRTGRGPPGRRRAREKDEQGGAAQAAPTRPLAARVHSSSKELSFKRSKPEPCNKSSGSKRQRPNAAAAEETGAEAPQKRSTSIRQGGSGLAPGGMHAAAGALGVDVCLQARQLGGAKGCEQG